jgi:hypothetical protein
MLDSASLHPDSEERPGLLSSVDPSGRSHIKDTAHSRNARASVCYGFSTVHSQYEPPVAIPLVIENR